jgi:hypothetical protein
VKARSEAGFRHFRDSTRDPRKPLVVAGRHKPYCSPSSNPPRIELDDAVIEAKVASWPDDAVF